jgi:DNA polymerase-3 subunit alpha
MFTHLHTHSTFSFLRGLASPQALVDSAVQEDMPALALTDHHGLTGAVEFYIACRSAGIQPILGLTVTASPPADIPAAVPGRLVLLAMDMSGWRSLCRLSSILAGENGSLPFDRLAPETAGLICLTGGVGSTLNNLVAPRSSQPAQIWLRLLSELFSDRIYIELNHHSPQDAELNTQLAALAHRSRIPVVAAHQVHYLTPDQWELQRVVTAIRLNRPLSDVVRRDAKYCVSPIPSGVSTSSGSNTAEELAPDQAYFTTRAEMQIKYTRFPAALERTYEIASRCKLELPLGVPHFPEIPLPAGQTALDLLSQRAESGARQLYHPFTAEVQSRLEHELAVIGQCGYAPLFLIVEEILNFARQQGVPISSRGSAASSLVAHCLGITSPDPLRLNLYFERFLNPARATPPDIDTDLCSRRREGVIRHVYDHFGSDQVATVCTINRFRSRSALREVAKAYGLPTEQVSRLAESLPHRWYGPPNRRSAGEDPYAELAEGYPSPLYQTIFAHASKLIGLPHHLSVHPGGVVISPGPMTDLVPTQMASKGVTITQLDLGAIERMGLVKIDLLGIRGLTVIGDVAEAIAARASISSPQYSHLSPGLAVLDSIPENDPLVSETIRYGRTIGCFQIESPGMRATLREINAQSVDDIMVALALYRPGPLTGGLKDAFVRRHLGKELTSYLHPALEPLLQDTYGVILYQEQVLRIAHGLAGLSLSAADLLRRAMSHFDPGKQMQTLKEKFIQGAAERNQVPQPVAEQVWEYMAAFAGYGFPKAHAASYAQIGWRSAWCKKHFPAEFMAAVLANWGGYYSQRVYLTEARRLGLTIRPPHISHASREFSVQTVGGQPILFMGLDQVKELTHRTQASIQRGRPFHSFTDFLARVDPRPAEVENLVKIGALEGFGSIPALLHQLSHPGWQGGQLQLFSLDQSPTEDWSLAEKVAAQEQLLGVSVIAHPLELAAGKIAATGALTTLEAATRIGQQVRVAGMRMTWRRTPTARGDYIYFMALEDLEGMLDVVIFSDVYRQARISFAKPGPYIVEGTLELGGEETEPTLRAERIWQL